MSKALVKGATLRDWFEKEDWRRVDDPSKNAENKMSLSDIKLYAMNAGALGVTTFTQIEDGLKILLLLITIGYTISKWVNIKRKKSNEVF